MSLETITEAVTDPSSEGIAGSLENLVARGVLPAGVRLPTVRVLARALAVSPTTVAAAWQQLVLAGVIETRGRAGSFVAERTGVRRRSWLSGRPGHYRIDLATGTADPTLLPDITEAIRRAATPTAASYMEPVLLPELETAVRAGLPFDPEAVTVVDGAIDAMDRVLAQVLRRGATVLVENPCFPPIAELVLEYGGRLMPIPIDDEGLDVEALETASSEGPTILIYQPRANNPTGVSVGRRRMSELSAFIANHPRLFVIEDDSAGDVCTRPAVTQAVDHPDRVVHIRSYSKSHGPDLRIAVLAGPARVIEAVVERRLLGPVWTSRILQRALVELLGDPDMVRRVSGAAIEYDRRRALLTAALAERDVSVHGTDGINIWVPVDNERDAMVVLASFGVGVTPGSPFQLVAGDAPHIRITLAVEPEDWIELADQIAEAAHTGQSPRRTLV